MPFRMLGDDVLSELPHERTAPNDFRCLAVSVFVAFAIIAWLVTAPPVPVMLVAVTAHYE